MPSAADATGIPRPQVVREADALAGVRVPPDAGLPRRVVSWVSFVL